MSKTTKILDKISSYSFLSGLVASKIQYLPANIATPFLNIASIALYLLGYSIWFATSYFYPNQAPQLDKWYGFAAFKEQNTYAASLGIIATLTGIAAIALPVLAIPAAGLFLASNVIWTVGEYHKLKNPPYGDENYSQSYQKSYVSYSIAMTSISAVGALATVLMFCLPALYLPTLVLSTLASIALVATALGYWFDFTFNQHQKTPVANPSYTSMFSNGLSRSLKLEESHNPKPNHHKGLFQREHQHEEEIELMELVDAALPPSCSM